MNFFTSTKSISIASILALSSAVADEASMSMDQECQMMAGYNASCRIEVQNPCNFSVTGSFIYWQPLQENTQLGIVSNSSAPEDLVNGYEVDLDYKYKPGFKVGFGMKFDYDNWDSSVEYTWFRAKEEAHVSLDPNNTTINLLPGWQIASFLGYEYDSGSQTWKLGMDLIDWDLGRQYYVGQELCFRPFIGVRAAFIRQNINVAYINETPSDLSVWPSTFITQTSHSWGIGPQLGLSSDWHLGKGFRIHGLGEVDILFTQYDMRFRQNSQVSTPSYFIIEKKNTNYLRNHVELALGLGWETFSFCNKYHIDLLADYGFQVFFDQNMFRSFVGAQSLGTNAFPNGNLYIQGLTFTARLDF